ncbi:MAG: hypothetical protein IJT21_04180 [Synergistaceae bacterium]|nr:hypothetical protein [Synergistaceae bacterium]
MSKYLNWTQSAAFLNISPEKFLLLHEQGIYPADKIVDGARFWDKEKLLSRQQKR